MPIGSYPTPQLSQRTYAQLQDECDRLRFAVAKLYQATSTLSMATESLAGSRPWTHLNGQILYGVTAQERIAIHDARIRAMQLCTEAGYAPPRSIQPAPRTTPQVPRFINPNGDR